jgi:hypothetical protein
MREAYPLQKNGGNTASSYAGCRIRCFHEPHRVEISRISLGIRTGFFVINDFVKVSFYELLDHSDIRFSKS